MGKMLSFVVVVRSPLILPTLAKCPLTFVAWRIITHASLRYIIVAKHFTVPIHGSTSTNLYNKGAQNCAMLLDRFNCRDTRLKATAKIVRVRSSTLCDDEAVLRLGICSR